MVSLPYDLIVHDAMILAEPGEDLLISRGAIGIKGGIIEKVWETPIEPAEYKDKTRELLDARGQLAIPGLVNTHTHAAMSLFRGLADDLPLMQWLQQYIFPAEARNVDQEFVFWGTMLACAEMIRSGTTTFADGYFFESSAWEAAKEAGMRAVLAQGVVDLPTPDQPDPSKNLEGAEAFVCGHLGDRRLRPAIFCHSAYTCTPETLTEAKAICKGHGIPFFIHAAETMDEVEEIKRKYDTTPIRHLSRLGILDKDTILVHCIWVDDEEVELIARAGAWVSITTESEMKLGSGVAPLSSFLSKGVKAALGTDSSASNNNLDMFQEMDLTAKLQKLSTMEPTVADAPTILKMATVCGAKLIGWSDAGRIKAGSPADLILLEMQSPHLLPLYSASSQIVYAARGADVTTSIIDGRLVMKDRGLLTIDEQRLFKRVRDLAKKIA